MTQTSGWHHVAIPVPDIARSEEWYCRVLGATVLNRIGIDPQDVAAGRNRAVWISVGDSVINLAEGDVIPRPDEAHFFHYALAAPAATIDDWIGHLEENGVEMFGPFGHGRSGAVSIYFDDPDNYRWEIAMDFGDYETAKREALARGGLHGHPAAPYEWKE